MIHLNFHDVCHVELRLSNSVLESIAEHYDYFRCTSSPDTPTITCEGLSNPSEPHSILGDQNQFFGRTNDGFLISGGSNTVLIDKSWNKLRVGSGCSVEFLAEILEYLMREQFAYEGFALSHSSGVQYDGETFLFHGWRHAGKTNALLTLLSKGGNYLGDDKLWLGEHGETLGFPLSVNVVPSNAKSFAETGDITRIGHWYNRIEQRIYNSVAHDPSLPERMIYHLLKNYSRVAGMERVPVHELFPQAERVDRSRVDAALMLRTVPSSESSAVSVEPLDSDTAAAEFQAVSSYEWNGTILEYLQACEALYPELNVLDRFERQLEYEQALFKSFADSVETYRLWIPQTEDWRDEGICSDLINCLDQLV